MSHFKFRRFQPQGTMYNDVLCVGMCPKIRPVGVTKKGKKESKMSCVKLAICPEHPRPCSPREIVHVESRIWEQKTLKGAL